MPPSSKAAQTAALLHSIVKNAKRVIDARLRALGLSAARVPLLLVLDRSGPVHQRELAVSCGLAARTVTELVDALERDGLVERRRDPNDRRAHEVHLTEAGAAILREVHAVHAQVIEDVLDGLGAERLDRLADTLGELDRRIRALDGSGAPPGPERCAAGLVGEPVADGSGPDGLPRAARARRVETR